MDVLAAVENVLQASGKPLHYKEFTERILQQDLWETQGQTPDATVNARLAMDIKHHGTASRFQRTAPGVFALREWGMPEHAVKAGAKKKPEGELKDKPVAATMSFTNAAEYVLKHFADQKPMHYKAITDKALELGLVHTEGQTPAATLYAQVLTEIKRYTLRGETPRFVKHGKGYVGLRDWVSTGLEYQIEQHNEEVRKKLFARVRQAGADDFEDLVAQLLVAIGFEEVNVTSRSKDGGIDVRGVLVVGGVIRTRMAVQAKKWIHKNVGAPVVQQVRGSLGTHEQGLIITTSDFSPTASKEANRPDAIPVALMNGQQFVDLLIENDIGIQRASYDLIELEEEEA